MANLTLAWGALMSFSEPIHCQGIDSTMWNWPGNKRLGIVVHGNDFSSAVDSTGSRIVRFQLDWGFAIHHKMPDHESESWDSPYNLDWFLSALSNYKSRGIDVLVNVAYRFGGGTYSADSAALLPDSANFTCPHISLGYNIRGCIAKAGTSAWTSFLYDWDVMTESLIVKDSAANGGGGALYWSPWNEPNSQNHKFGWFRGSNAQYDTLAAHFCKIVHRHRRKCVGPDAAIAAEPDTTYPGAGRPWLNDRINAAELGDSSWFDAISFHLHGRSDVISALSDSIASQDAAAGMREAWWQGFLTLFTKPARPAWNTETSSPGQSANLELIEKDLALKAAPLLADTSHSKVQVMFQYSLASDDAGMIDVYGHRRPAYFAFPSILNRTYHAPSPSYCTSSFAGDTSTVSCTQYQDTRSGYSWSPIAAVGIHNVFDTYSGQEVVYSLTTTGGYGAIRYDWYVNGSWSYTGYGSDNSFAYTNSGVPFTLRAVVTDWGLNYTSERTAYVEPFNPCYPYDCNAGASARHSHIPRP